MSTYRSIKSITKKIGNYFELNDDDTANQNVEDAAKAIKNGEFPFYSSGSYRCT